jgi:uncharacterized short protein YbdD (DUF466 family)
MTARDTLAKLVWYLKELTGEHDYDRYVEHHRHAHPDASALSRREFERMRMDERDRNPSVRCC